ncbi:ParB N-terminal domain-containing protein [Paenibacillus kandeliae]|uniref:ParB N-terminal domain-containing protein n=1 Tax=Paenibacillus kandeliae TaxID=3231269 RepID=UPI0034586016
MEIITLSIDQINAAAYNPRIDLQPGDSEYEKLKRSIAEFGYIDPIIWNRRTGNMVGGHQRYKIMVHEIGAAELPVSVVDLDEQQERILNITLNKVGGGWDEQKLSDVLQELQTTGLDLNLTGFDEVELKQLIGEVEIPLFEEGTADDQGDLGVLSSKLVTCPHCGEEFEHD